MRGAALLVCMLAAVAQGAAAQQDSSSSCTFEDAGSGTVRAVLDGRTFVLTDGREVRLDGIEVPQTDHRNAAQAARLRWRRWSAAAARSRSSGSTLADRYGRLLAYAFVPGDERSAQQSLLAAGHARVAARVGNAACAARLLSAERAARDAGLGLWGEASYALRKADDPAAVLAERGRFTLVEGRVISVRESGGTIYVNFGRRWTEDFTVTVLRRHERTFGRPAST